MVSKLIRSFCDDSAHILTGTALHGQVVQATSIVLVPTALSALSLDSHTDHGHHSGAQHG